MNKGNSLKEYLNGKRQDGILFLVDKYFNGVTDPHEKGQAAEKVQDLLMTIPNEITRDEYAFTISDKYNIKKGYLLKEPRLNVDKQENQLSNVGNKPTSKERFDVAFDNALTLLPVFVKDHIIQNSKAVNTHPEIFLLSSIIGLANAMGNKFSLQTRWKNYAVFFGMNVGSSSSGKSLSVKSLEPVKAKDKKLKRQFNSEYEEFKNSNQSLPYPKRKHAFLTNNTSIQELLRTLSTSQSLILWIDEFEGLLSQLKSSNGTGEAWRSNLNTLYSAFDFKQVYAKDKGELYEGDDTVLNLLCNIHPPDFAELHEARSNMTGFNDRFIFIPLLKSPRTPNSSIPSVSKCYKEYFDLIDNFNDQVDITLSSEAAKLSLRHEKTIHARIIQNESKDESLVRYLRKSNIVFERLILWLHVTGQAEAEPYEMKEGRVLPEVEPFTVEKAGKLTMFFIECWEICRTAFMQNQNIAITASDVAKTILSYKPDVNKAQVSRLLGFDRTLFNNYR